MSDKHDKWTLTVHVVYFYPEIHKERDIFLISHNKCRNSLWNFGHSKYENLLMICQNVHFSCEGDSTCSIIHVYSYIILCI